MDPQRFSKLQPFLCTTINNIVFQTQILTKCMKKIQLKTIITDQMIIIGSQFIKFQFDVRFSCSQSKLIFYYQDQEIAFTLMNKDYLQIRCFLKKFLNQRGFHEQFKAIKRIGQGNFASVYLVKHLSSGKQMAVKAFSKQAAYSEQNGKACLIKQIEIMRHLSHKNNMKLQEVFQSDNSLYLVFEMLQGGMLYDRIKLKKKFTPKDTRKIIFCILEGLVEMHRKGIMHRDLKPENILMRTENQSVIADYGLSEYVNQEKYLFTRCGTPGYVAPEVINITDMNAKYSSVCDMFSLGLIFHMLVFGKSVFTGKTYGQVLKQNRACNFNLQTEEYKQMASQTMDLMKKMLKVKPQQRITSQEAIQHAYFKQLYQQCQQHLDLVTQLPSQLYLKPGSSSISTQTQSPILTTSNIQRKQNKFLPNDSCIGFKLGKDITFTGKKDTVGSINMSKVSLFGGKLVKGQGSKFIRQQQQKQQKIIDKENL